MKTIRNIIAAALAGVAAIAPAAAQPINRALEAGFLPDPEVVTVNAGGPIELDEAHGEGCTGFVTEAPTVRLAYTSSADQPELYFAARSDVDTVLVVRTPDGRTTCNDDRSDETLDPGISFSGPQSGIYEIWVGTYDDNEAGAAELHISEIGFGSDGND